MSNELIYNDSGIKFIMLNILGHDVIHDFGGNSTPERWAKNLDIVSQFTGSYTFSSAKIQRLKGGMNSSTVTEMMPSQSNSSSSGSYQMRLKRKPSLVGTRLSLNEEEINDAYYKFIYDLNLSCIFCFFYYKVYINTNSSFTLLDMLIASFGFMLETNNQYTSKIQEIFEEVCSGFITYLYFNNQEFYIYVEQGNVNNDTTLENFSLPYVQFYNILVNFLDTNRLSDSILACFSPVEEEMTQSTIMPGQKRGFSQLGGAKDELLKDFETEIKPFVEDLEAYKSKYLTENNLNNLAQIYFDFKNNMGNIDPIKKEEYSQLRNQMLTELKTLLTTHKQFKTSGQVDNSSIDTRPDSFIPILKVARGGKISSISSYPVEGALNYFNSIYESYKKKYNKIIEKQEKPLIKKASDETKKKEPALPRAETEIRQNFNIVVARVALYLNGICDLNGNLIVDPKILTSEFNDINYFLREEMKILLYHSEWFSQQYKKPWNKVYSITNLDSYLFDITLSYFNEKGYTIPDGAEIYCGKGVGTGNEKNSKYIIDNAAGILNNGIKNRIYCSTSSILDGMFQCSWNTSSGQMEQGNMDFSIKNDTGSYIYNGKATFIDLLKPNRPKNINKIKNVRYDVDINCPMGKINPLAVYDELGLKSPYINIDRTSSPVPFEAKRVLANTLLLIIRKLELLSDTNVNEYQELINTSVILSQPTNEPKNIFFNFFNKQLTNQNNSNYNFFFNIFANIYYKGCGDLFQEINCVCKNGGYLNDGSYYADDTVMKWNLNNSTGNNLRMFIAKDQPSACRYAIMLMFGRPDCINNYAFGGYSSDRKQLIVSRAKLTKTNSNVNNRDLVCNPQKYIQVEPTYTAKPRVFSPQTITPISIPSSPQNSSSGLTELEKEAIQGLLSLQSVKGGKKYKKRLTKKRRAKNMRNTKRRL
jgi:hypothetical protein